MADTFKPKRVNQPRQAPPPTVVPYPAPVRTGTRRKKSSGDKAREAKPATTPAANPPPAAAPDSVPVTSPAPVAASGNPKGNDARREALLSEQKRIQDTIAQESARGGYGPKAKDAQAVADRRLPEIRRELDSLDSADAGRAKNEALKLIAEVSAGTVGGVMIARAAGRGEISRARSKAREVAKLANAADTAMKAGGSQVNRLSGIVNQTYKLAGEKRGPITVGGRARPMPSSLGGPKHFHLKANAGIAVALAADAAIGRFVIPAITDDAAVQDAARITANISMAATVAFLQTRKVQNAAASKVGPKATDLAKIEAAHQQVVSGRADSKPSSVRAAARTRVAKATAAAEKAGVVKGRRSVHGKAHVASNEAAKIANVRANGVRAGKRAAAKAAASAAPAAASAASPATTSKMLADTLSKKPNAGWSDAARSASAESRAANAAKTAGGVNKMASGVDDIAGRLKGLKGQALKNLAADVGARHAKTQAGLRANILQSIEHAGKQARRVLNTEGEFRNVSPKEGFAAYEKSASMQEARVRAAIDKVASAAPSAPGAAKVTKAKVAGGVDKMAKGKAPKAPKADVLALAAKAKAALAATGDPMAKRAALDAASAEIKAAKLSKAGSHALAKEMGIRVAPSSAGKAVVEHVTHRLGSLSTFLMKQAAMSGRSAAVLTGAAVVGAAAMKLLSTPVMAGVGAGLAVNDSVQKGDDARLTAAKAVAGATDMVTMGALTIADDYAKAEGYDGGLVDMIKAGYDKVMETAGLADPAPFSAAAAQEINGGMTVGERLTTGAIGAAVAGTGVEVMKIPGVKAKIVGGVMTAVGAAGLVEAVTGGSRAEAAGAGPDVAVAAPQGKAYLNDAAKAKAMQAPRPAAVPLAGQQTAAVKGPDGETAGYSRMSSTGLVVQVQGYKTPSRKK